LYASTNSLLGVTNISGLLGAHIKSVGHFSIPALTDKLFVARQVLSRKRGEYLRKVIKDERRCRVLPKCGVTKDGLGQLSTVGKHSEYYAYAP
jgi:hypothetical protein